MGKVITVMMIFLTLLALLTNSEHSILLAVSTLILIRIECLAFFWRHFNIENNKGKNE